MIPLSTGDPLRLGPYRLLGILGEGGMGKVYFGRDNAGRAAAVKVLRRELAHDGNLAQRFLREAQTAQAVTSSGVARVLEARTEGGRPWIAAEFLAGPTLDDAVTAYGPLDEPAFRSLAASLARTLQDIHAAGLIHRDLKPPNIVLTSGGPRVIDFGIARPEHGLTLTTTGQIPVTPGYGAPEQVLGQRVGPAADVFSLGALLVYAAGGQRAYDGPHVAGVQYQVVHGEPDMRHVPDVLRPLLLPCLAKNPAERPLPAQIAEALTPPRGAEKVWRQGPLAADIAHREAGAAALTTTRSDDPARPSRRRLLTVLATAGTVVAAGGGTAAWWLNNGKDSPDAEKPVDVPPAAARPAAAEPWAVDAELKPLWGPLSGADFETRAPLPVRDVVVFGAAGGGLAARRVTDGGQKWAAPDVESWAGYVTVADRLVVGVDGAGALHAHIASTGVRAWTLPGSVEVVLAADARTVYVMTRERRLRAISVATRKTLWSVTTPVRTSAADPPAAAAGAGRLVLFSSDGKVAAVDTATGRTVWDIPSQGTEATAPAVVKDRVYLGGGTLTARSLGDGKNVWSVPAETKSWGPPTVRGNEVYAAEGLLHRFAASTGRKQWTSFSNVTSEAAPVVQAGTVWSPTINDGGVEAYSARDGEYLDDYSPDSTGTYTMSGDGNRLFVAHAGTLAAFPVRA